MQEKIRQLERKALWVRRQILETITSAKNGHIGGALSCTDILVALYYGGILRFDPRNPNCDSKDRFILSKGHSCVALFVILADLGFFPLSELDSYCQNGSMLGGHPDRNIPGIEADTGSLGHGLGIAAGLALSFKMDAKDCMSVVLLGDGECYEGSIWEAAMFAAHHSLNNLLAIVDRNCQCVTDFTEDCNRIEPFEDKWHAFGWDTVKVDGHSFEELFAAFEDLRQPKSYKPLVIIADTVKGKGVSFMEKKIQWHHGVPGGKELEIARQQLALK
ncbi:MAG: transketolase [Planctomycetota bacterium]|jgi:transketolase